MLGPATFPMDIVNMNHVCFKCSSVAYITYYQSGKLLCRVCLDETRKEEQDGNFRQLRDDRDLSRSELLSRVLNSSKDRKDS